MSDDPYAGLRTRLHEAHTWPGEYTLKAVAPVAMVEEVVALLPDDATLSRRESRKGNFVSLTLVRVMGDPEEVIALYRALSAVKGVMLL